MKRRARKAAKPKAREPRPEREPFIGFRVGPARHLPILPRDRHAPGAQIGGQVTYPDD